MTINHYIRSCLGECWGKTMSDENEETPMAECGSCRAIVPINTSECPECGISFSGVSDEALGECGACNSLVPLDSTKCPDCGVVFVADDVVDILRSWMAMNKMDVKTLFGRFDTNNDNMIDSGELKEGLLSLNLADLPPSQVDRLVEAIDEDGDSLIDLVELQSIIGGEELQDDSGPSDDGDEQETLQFNENVLSKIMQSFEIDESDKEEFIAFAGDFNTDGNQYLKKEELQTAAEAWNARTNLDATDVGDTAESAEEESDESEPVSEEELDEDVSEPEEDSDDTEEIHEDDALDEEEAEEQIFETDSEEDDSRDIIETESDDPGEEDEEEDVQTESFETQRSSAEIIEQLLDVIEEEDKSLVNAFGDLDDDGDRLLTSEELVHKLNVILPHGLTESEAESLLSSMDTDGDGNIDMIEFVNAIERHEDEISTIEDEEAETVKTFPTEMQTRFMSKKWHDVYWPLIHTSFAILIVGLLVNALIPFVDGTGGMVEFDAKPDAPDDSIMIDGKVISEGDAYPCVPEYQEGECKNSLTPFSGKASSMPGGFYLDAIILMIISGLGLIWSLYTHLILAPGWRARLKAMRDVDDDRAEVQEAIEDEEKSDMDENEDESTSEEISDEEADEDSEETDADDVEEPEEEEFDIGSYVGLEIDGEDYYGTIIEFDDDEGTVVIEEDETGDEIVGYQDEMFIPEE
tara:strand:- start:6062 stop:8143 length:2082 start_codon:yes stop_codon:yes gene_type:complete